MLHRLPFIIVILTAAIALAEPNVTGKAVFKGEPPPPKKLNMALDQHCAKHEAAFSEDYVVGKSGELANVVVWVKEGLEEGKEYTVPAEPVKVTQKGCVYRPHVVALMVGQTMMVDNGDDTMHNVHGMPKVNAEFNVVQQQKGATNKWVFKAPEEKFILKCDVHPWMKAWIYVFAHPFYGISREDGTFALPQLPPGEYTIVAQHERAGVQEQKVTVEAGKKVELSFTFELKKKN
jgi:plastocyanin